MNPKVMEILKNGSTVDIKKLVEAFSISKLQEIRSELDDRYYNSESPLIPDSQYDIFYEALLEKTPEEKKKVGTRVREKNIKVTLPYWMGSLDKKKDQKTIDRWLSKLDKPVDFFISEKLDGLSLLLEYKGGEAKLYTRGDGKIGSDVTHLYQYLNLPLKNLDKKDEYFIRGELIVSKENYEKYQKEYDNPRQMVSGIVNAHSIKKGIEVVDFVAYQIMNSKVNISKQFQELQRLGFKIPQHTTVKQINSDSLKILLQEMEKNSNYYIDGLVITTDEFAPPNTSGNPENSWAFKVIGKTYETVVKEVIWNISKAGALKPTIKVKPVQMEDVVVSMVTGFNARYVRDNGIGEGSVIKIVRSGDVIPHIVEVVKPSTPSFPDVKYKWNANGVDILLDVDSENKEMEEEYNIKKLSSFCSGLGIPNLGQSTVTKLYKAGWNTMKKILESEVDSFENVKGLGKKSSEKIYLSIRETIPEIEVSKFIAASAVLGNGIGEKKLDLILEVYPDFFFKKYDQPSYVNMLNDIKGFSDKTTEKIIQKIDETLQLVREYDTIFGWTAKLDSKRETSTDDKNKILDNCVFVFTGFRDRDLEEAIKNLGGCVADRVTNSTTHLVVKKSTDKPTSKIRLAEEKGIEIVYLDWLLSLVSDQLE